MPLFTDEQLIDRQMKITAIIREGCPSIPFAEADAAARTLAQMDLAAFQALLDRRMNDFPDHLPATEGRIISRLLDDALAQEDIQIAVDWDDLEDEGLAFTRDRAAIEREIAATSITFLRFFRANLGDKAQPQGRLGWVMLVHGNMEDVLSDYSANEFTKALVHGANKLAEDILEESLV